MCINALGGADHGGLFAASTVRARVSAASWSDAIEAAGALLVESGSCDRSYVGAMRAAVSELGPYVVVAPGVAMPHARPEQGVHAPGVALATLDKPVKFGHPDNDPVDLVIPFAAVDKRSHLDTLRRLSELLADPAAVAAVRGAATDQELRAVLGVPDGATR